MLSASAPLVFEPNQGQAPANVKWLARGSRFVVGLTSDGAVLEFRDEGNPPASPQSLQPLTASQPNPRQLGRRTAPPPVKSSAVTLRLTGSAAWNAAGMNLTGGISNYFLGNTAANWHTKIPHYSQVKATGVYKGIDMVFRGDRGDLAYDFVVAPGADPKQIQLRFDGASGMHLDKGDLVLATPGGTELRHLQPKISQQVGGKQVTVKGGFEVHSDGSAGFTVGTYDPRLPLVIDPTISFVRFLAGSDYDEATAVAADPTFNSYVTGYTYSANFPVVGQGNVGHSSGADAFFTKLSPTGTILSSTYLGGSNDDMGFGVAVDASGVYLTGQTQSSDFPHYPLQPGLQGDADAFVIKFSLLGDTIFYARLLGGSDWDGGYAIAVDSARSPYIVGTTYSLDFPVTPAAFQTHAGNPGAGHGFVTKLSPSGGLLVYSTYIASDDADDLSGVAVDSSGSAIVVGNTSSFTFPFAGYSSQDFALGAFSTTVTKLAPAGDSLIYSTGIGPQSAWAHGVAVDSAGNAYVVGNSYTGLGTKAAAAQAFVAKVSPVGASLYFKSLVGTNGSSVANAVAVDASGDTWVGGSTSSNDFPGAPPLTPNPSAGFVSKLDPSGNGPLYTVLLGATVDGVAEFTAKPRIVVEPAYPTIWAAGMRFTGGTAQSDADAFVVRLDEGGNIVIGNQ